MHIVRIPKRNGTFRTIYVPNKEEKLFLSKLVPELNARALIADRHAVMHGFMPGRSPVTNAMQHRGHNYTLSFDIEDFFDSVKRQMIGNANTPLWDWAVNVLDTCFVDGAARQGLPTSPAIANIAVAPMVNEIMKLRQYGRFGWNFLFTIYADDLSFSFERFATSQWLRSVIPEIVERHGFKVNPKKTVLQCARSGRRMITGVAVDGSGIHVPRSIKRRMRAAKYRMNETQHRGLLEWSKLNLPKAYRFSPLPQSPITAAIQVVQATVHQYIDTFGSWARKIIR